MSAMNNKVISLVIFSVISFLVWVSFSPGITGGLVFDDVRAIGLIEKTGQINDLNTLLTYLFSAGSSDLKRPIAMMSFLIGSHDGNIDTVSLKVTNIFLHIVTSVAVYIFTLLIARRLMNRTAEDKSVFIFAAVVTFLWSVNPMHVSTVSYIVQRMAILAALFSLLALIVFLKALEKNIFDTPGPRYVFYYFLFGFLMLLGILSKESAILLAFFMILVRFYAVDENCHVGIKEKFWFASFSLIPISMLVVYLVLNVDSFVNAYKYREFSMPERVMTQWRLLLIYIKQIIFTDVNQLGLFVGDGIVVSKGFLGPWSTCLSLLSIIVLCVVAVVIRHSYPLIGFGILFYFIGHLLESSFLPLELYFEHRNYLPQVGVWIAVVGALYHIENKIDRKLLIGFFLIAIGSYSFSTYTTASKWENNFVLSEFWYESVESQRTAMFYAVELYNYGAGQEAIDVLGKLNEMKPKNFSIGMSYQYLRCVTDKDYIFDYNQAIYQARLTEAEAPWIKTVENMLQMIREGKGCDTLTYQGLQDILNVLSKNEKVKYVSKQLWNLYNFSSEIGTRLNDLNHSIFYLDKACEVGCVSPIRLRQAYYLYTAGLVEESKKYADKARELNDGFVDRIKYPRVSVELDKLYHMYSKLELNGVQNAKSKE